MKKVILLFFVIAIFAFSSSSLAYKTRHVYISGKVDGVTEQYVVVSGTKYYFAQKVKAYVEIKRDKAIETGNGRLSDIRIGDFVSMKKDGNVIVEITVER